MARGDRGELRVINPNRRRNRGHQLTVKTAAGEKSETVAGDTNIHASVARIRKGGAR